MKSSTFVFSWKSNKEFKQGESKFKRWRACNKQTISNDVGTKARWAKALIACVNSLTCPKVKFRLNQHEGGTTWTKTWKGKVGNRTRSKDKASTSTCAPKKKKIKVPPRPWIKIVKNMSRCSTTMGKDKIPMGEQQEQVLSNHIKWVSG